MECYGERMPKAAGHWAPRRMLGASVRSCLDGSTAYVNVRIGGVRRMYAVVEVAVRGRAALARSVRTGAGEADVLKVVNAALGTRYTHIDADSGL